MLLTRYGLFKDGKDITDELPYWILHECEIQQDVTLRDILLLIRMHMEFMQVILYDGIEEVVMEGLTQPNKVNEDLKYLALYSTMTEPFENVCFPELYAVDRHSKAHAATEIPVNEIAHLPIRHYGLVSFGPKSDTYVARSLAQILYGIAAGIETRATIQRRQELKK